VAGDLVFGKRRLYVEKEAEDNISAATPVAQVNGMWLGCGWDVSLAKVAEC
jgi:hypothetical protein